MKPIPLTAVAFLALGAMAFSSDPAVPPLRALPPVAFTLRDFVAQTPKSEAGNYLMEIPEIVNLTRSEEARKVLLGKAVEFTGQAVADPANPQRLRIVRSLIPCCVAHVRQYAVVVEFDGPVPEVRELAWLKLVGTVAFEEQAGQTKPIVRIKEFAETAQPANLLLH